jgi:fimbrial isopeptide formation D2 family protein/LPXTG-motif cell wall-anchored protein
MYRFNLSKKCVVPNDGYSMKGNADMDNTQGARSWKRRLVGLAGAIGITLAGFVGFAGTATADPPPGPTEEGAPTTATLTIHKIAGTETDNPNDGTEQTVSGTKLAGVTFTVTPVTAKGGTAIDLSTAAGWQLIEDATVATVMSSAYTKDTDNISTVTTTAPDGTATFSGNIGLYLVQETSAGTNPTVSLSAPFIVTLPLMQEGSSPANWLYDVHAYPKNQLVDPPTKEVSTPEGMVDGKIPWTINQTIPTLNSTDSLTRFEITDELDTRLLYTSDADVTVGIDSGSSLTVGTHYTLSSPAEGSTGTLKVTFTEAGRGVLSQTGNQGKNVVVTFKTTVSENGEFENTAYTNINDVEKDTNEVKTLWGGILIHKKDAATSEMIDTATFDLYASDEEGNKTGDPIATGSTSDGILEFDKLWIGNNDSPTSRDYYIVETAAPDGYVLNSVPQKVTVQKTGTGETATYVTQVDVLNRKPIIPGLPLTGSSGTVIIVSAGVALLIGAAGLLFLGRRRNSAR